MDNTYRNQSNQNPQPQNPTSPQPATTFQTQPVQPVAPSYAPPVPNAQPPLASQYDALIVSELRGLRVAMDALLQATDSGFQQLADMASDEPDEEDEEERESVLETPASSTTRARKAASSQRTAMGTKAKRDAAGSKRSGGKRPLDVADSDDDDLGLGDIPRRKPMESRTHYLDRLKSLPPIGPRHRLFGESRAKFQARRFDGTAPAGDGERDEDDE